MERLKRKQTIILFILFFATMLITIACKKNFHVDEIFSYTLSNGTGGMNFEEEHTYTPAAQSYYNNMIVNNAPEMFNFPNVWKNQTNDVHPPLYYVLLHIMCSFYVGRFSVWCAGIINICFALGTLYILRKLMDLLCRDRVVVNITRLFP